MHPAAGANMPDFRRLAYQYYSRVEGRWPTAPGVDGWQWSTNTPAAADHVPEASIANSSLHPSSQPNSATLSAAAPRMKPKRPMLIENW